MDWLSWLPQGVQDGYRWVIGPSIVPWVGAVAAVFAAFLTSPGSWLKHFWFMIPRAVLVVVFWFVGIWLLNYAMTQVGITPPGIGGGPGPGGGEVPNGSNTTADGKSGGSAPAVGGRSISLGMHLWFEPSPAHPDEARNLRCRLEVVGHPLSPAIIKGDTQAEFDTKLVATVKLLAPPTGTQVFIHRKPDPGNVTAKRLRDLIKATTNCEPVIVSE